MATLIVRETDAQYPATAEQIQFLIDHLEEESYDDQDYYLNRATIDLLATKGADPALVTMLLQALGDREGIEVIWEGYLPPEVV